MLHLKCALLERGAWHVNINRLIDTDPCRLRPPHKNQFSHYSLALAQIPVMSIFYASNINFKTKMLTCDHNKETRDNVIHFTWGNRTQSNSDRDKTL